MHVTDGVTSARRERMSFCRMFNVAGWPGTQAVHAAGQNLACQRKPLSASLPSCHRARNAFVVQEDTDCVPVAVSLSSCH